jgi:uncharacterized membrane protein
VAQPPTFLDRHSALPAAQRVPLDRPLHWLRAGLDDLMANPLPGLAYGLLFSIGGDLILLASLEEPYLFMTALSGFFLVAPLLAAGLYELSRLRAAGAHPGFIDSLTGLRRSLPALALFGVVLAMVAVLWEQITAVSFSLFVHREIGLSQFVQTLTEGEHRAFMATWFILGACLALVVFAFSVVSAPLILDRDADFITAITTSLRVFILNLEVMVLWAAIIVLLVLVSFATLMVGLVFTMPVLGHATWHAYRELVK